MATYYCSSVIGNDTFTGATWALAKATIAGALAVATSTGDIIYVDSAHAEAPAAAITWNIATSGANVSIISVNRNGSITTGHSGWLAGAKATVNTTAQIFSIVSSGAQQMYMFGITCESGNGTTGSDIINLATAATNNYNLWCDNCTFTVRGTSVNSSLFIGASVTNVVSVRFSNCTFNLANVTGTSGGLRFNGNLVATLINPTFAFFGATKPTALFGFPAGARFSVVRVQDADLSGYNASGGAYVNVAQCGVMEFTNCKLSSVPSFVTGAWSTNAASITVVDCDSADTHNAFQFRNRLGTLTQNTSVYSNLGAQFDAANIGWEIDTTSACNEAEPFITPWLSRWSGSIASQVFGVRVVSDSATNYHNRNLWPEFEYLSSASFPQGTLYSGRNAQPFDGSTVDWAADTDTWTGTGGFANPNKQKLETTVTPAEKSLIRGRLFVGIASKTLYVDPLLRIT